MWWVNFCDWSATGNEHRQEKRKMWKDTTGGTELFVLEAGRLKRSLNTIFHCKCAEWGAQQRFGSQ